MDANKRIDELEAIWNLTPDVEAEQYFVLLRESAAPLGLRAIELMARVHRVMQFDSQQTAAAAIRWMFDKNPGAFESGQVVKGRKVVQTLTPTTEN